MTEDIRRDAADDRSRGPVKAIIASLPLRYKLGAAGVAVALVLLAIVGHAIGGGGIKAGDCVTTFTDPLNDNSHIFKASCSSPPAFYYRVLQVQDSTGGNCLAGDTTFQDDPANKTYCLAAASGAP
jgi:hypothetical protein